MPLRQARLRAPSRGLHAALVIALVLCAPTLAFADFCSGKQNGLWCDGNNLVNCKSGKISSSQSCPSGCQSMPPGTPDKCKTSTNFCTGKANGKWCDGSKLVTCSGGNVASSSSCPDGCQQNPPGTDDACKAATNFCTGKANGKWCDGSKLVSCSGGKIASSSSCPDGCQQNPPGTDDACKAATTFCTGKQNGAWCDGDKLLQCKDGAIASSQSCPSGCQSMPVGVPDQCKSASTPGFCQGKQNGAWCDGDKLVQCKDGAIASSQSCPSGCQSMPVGVPDQCKAATSSFCQGKQSGAWCDGDKLVQCQAGVQTSSQTCANGCESMPVGVPDQCKSGSGAGSGSGGLELCQPFSPPKSVTCGYGCYDGHKGSDYAAADGTPIYAPTTGKVVKVVKSYSGQTCSPDFGNYVKIATGPYELLLAHMRKDILVGEGDIKAGTPIGYVSNTGYTLTYKNGAWVCQQGGGHHLHLEVRKNGVAFDAHASAEVSWKSCAEVGSGGSGGTNFCTGKQNGAWCDGAALVQCSGGQVASSKSCPAGCQSNPAGVPDACKAEGGTSFCTGKQNGAWCDGDALVTCQNGAKTASQTCPEGCQSNPAGVADVCKAKASGPCAGKSNGLWCAGDKLLLCQQGAVVSEEGCPAGCQSNPDGVPDACKVVAAGPCGGKGNAIFCDGDTLRVCAGDKTIEAVVCKEGCGEVEGAAACNAPAKVDACAGKGDGAHCAGEVLFQCAKGVTVTATPCALGCGDLGGVDGCLAAQPGEADPCAALVDGGHCAGGGLRVCAGGVTTATSACANGCGGAAGKASCLGPAGQGVCAAAADGWICDGNKRVRCEGGAVHEQLPCAYGCAPGSGGEGAQCLPLEAAACAAAGDGAVCAKSVLLQCSGGLVKGATMCMKGCAEQAGIASCEGDVGFCADKVDGAWCSAGHLVHCLAQAEVFVEACKFGCSVQPGAAPDFCASAQSGFCADRPDGAYCDASWRVACAGGLEVQRVACAAGCSVSSGTALCADGGDVACGALADGVHCVGAALVHCEAGKASSAKPCTNGCSEQPGAAACVEASAGGSEVGVVVDGAGCARWVGDLSPLAIKAQDQSGFGEQLGACADKTIAEHGALITTLSTVYAALGGTREAFGVAGNTPAIENVWRREHDGYLACSDGQSCCARWDRNPAGIGFDLATALLGDCLPAAVAFRVASALIAKRPVVAGVHRIGNVAGEHYVTVVGIAKGELLVIDPKGGGGPTALSALGEVEYVVDFVAVPRLDGAGPFGLDGAGVGPGGLPGGPGMVGGGGAGGVDADGGSLAGGDGFAGADGGAWVPQSPSSSCSAGARPSPSRAALLVIAAAVLLLAGRRRRRALAQTWARPYTAGPWRPRCSRPNPPPPR